MIKNGMFPTLAGVVLVIFLLGCDFLTGLFRPEHDTVPGQGFAAWYPSNRNIVDGGSQTSADLGGSAAEEHGP